MPNEADQTERWKRREAELRQEWARVDLEPEAKEMAIQGLLRDEMAAEVGADPAAMEAVALVRQYGLRRARQLYCDPVTSAYLGSAGGDSAARTARIAHYLDQMRAELPWWRRLIT